MHSNGVFNRRSYSILRQIRFSSDHVHVDAKIKALIQQGNYSEALESYSKEPCSPIKTSKFTFPSLLKACTSLSLFHYGETLHSAVTKLGLHFDPYIASSLVRMYVKYGSLGSAVQLFDEMSSQDVAIWNSIIDGYSKHGLFKEGIFRFRQMQETDVKPDRYTLSILLGMCNGCIVSSCVKEIHGYVMRNMFDDDPFVTTALIDSYSKSRRIVDAWNVFDMSEDNWSIAVWNSMFNGFCENWLWRNALQLYTLGKNFGLELGSTTFSCLLTACSQGDAVDFGLQLHCDVVKTGFESDPYVTTSALTFYSKCGVIKDAEKVFYFACDRPVEIWNSMISGYVNWGHADNALDVYTEMRCRQVAPDSFTWSNVLIACSMIGSQCLGKIIHAELLKRLIKDSIEAQSALLTMYSKLRIYGYARRVFSQIREKDVVAWGSIISGSCENREFKEALSLYKTMESDGLKPDASVIASLISACVGLSNGKLGSCVHGLAIKEGFDMDAFTGSVLIDFYCKLGQPRMAKTVFSSVVVKNLVVWNSLMSCFSQNGLPNDAIRFLIQIQQDGLRPDSVSIATILAAVSQMAALLKGKTIHGYLIKSELLKDIHVENALTDMYIKCGSFVYAERVFQNMAKRDVIAWNLMIAGYGSHGECHKAIELYNQMVNSGTQPDETTFLGLISACNHCGYLAEGMSLFLSMKEHKVEPKMEHYINLVDLLGRSGRLQEAFRFIQSMAIAPGRGIWLSLLSSCRVHRNVELGKLAAQKLIEIEPERGSNYAQMMNMYVEAGMKEKAAEVRAEMRQRGVAKQPGCSWIEGKDRVDVFFSGDSSGARGVEIYETLDCLKNAMKGKEWKCEPEVVYEGA